MSQKYIGKVVGLKSAKTATVELIFTKLHPKYHKPIRRKKNFQVHNESFALKIDDKVEIKNSGRKYSKTKSFVISRKENK
jgi:small subunit ribosomal protein S17